jgi:perosamine synthetase
MSQPQIPVAIPDLSGNEEKYVLEAMRSSWISSTGPFVQRFEQDFAALCETRTAIGVCNGTVALHLALLAPRRPPWRRGARPLAHVHRHR